MELFDAGYTIALWLEPQIRCLGIPGAHENGCRYRENQLAGLCGSVFMMLDLLLRSSQSHLSWFSFAGSKVFA